MNNSEMIIVRGVNEKDSMSDGVMIVQEKNKIRIRPVSAGGSHIAYEGCSEDMNEAKSTSWPASCGFITAPYSDDM